MPVFTIPNNYSKPKFWCRQGYILKRKKMWVFFIYRKFFYVFMVITCCYSRPVMKFEISFGARWLGPSSLCCRLCHQKRQPVTLQSLHKPKITPQKHANTASRSSLHHHSNHFRTSNYSRQASSWSWQSTILTSGGFLSFHTTLLHRELLSLHQF